MKQRRQSAILQIIRNKEIGTQEELALELQRAHIPVTQATISRDIKELRLVKILGNDGVYRYVEANQPPPGDVLKRAQRTFADYVIGLNYSGNLIIIKTTPGTAQTVAGTIDDLGWEEIIATVGGDDAILVVIREEGKHPPQGNVGEVLTRFDELCR